MIDLRKAWQRLGKCYIQKMSTTKYCIWINWTSSHKYVERKEDMFQDEFKYYIYDTAVHLDNSYDENKISIN